MKACPFCAEQIQDEALKCRFCGSDVSRAPAVGEGALAFSHSGHRYLLGYGNDFFGIWDRSVAGPPVQRFPRTQEGWDQAWHRFIATEPGAIEVPSRGQPAPSGTVSPLGAFRSAHTLARYLMALLGGAATMQLLVMLLRLQQLHQIRAFLNERIVPPGAEATNSELNLVGFVSLLVVVGTVVVWLMWQHRSHSNLKALGSANLRFTPPWVVGWWFIPIGNWAVPYLTLRELWKGSAPEAGAADWQRGRAPALLGLWWAGWIAAGVLTVIAVVRVGANAQALADPTLQEIMHRLSFGAAANGVLALTGALAILVVRGIDARQEAKYGRLMDWARSQRASAAPPAVAA